jgi:hypothetical protein
MRRRPLRKRLRAAAVGAPVLVVFGFGLLFLIGWQTHRCEALRRQSMQLRRESEFRAAQVQRLQARWHTATSRTTIVARAERELGLKPAPVSADDVLVLQTPDRSAARSELLARVRRGLDRYGRVSEALAGEVEQP